MQPSLFQEPFNEQPPAISSFEFIAIQKIVPNPNQPRKFFDSEKIDELAQSIRASGILQPILVRRREDFFEIISGERRFHAAKKAGLVEVPAVLKSCTDQEMQVAALVENLQREDLNPIEEAHAIREILVSHGLTHDQLAEQLGRSRSSLTNLLRMLRLPESVQTQIIAGKVSPGHAKMLAGLESPEEILYWTDRIVTENLSVYETEKQLSLTRQKKGPAHARKAKTLGDVNLRLVEDRLGEQFGAKVRIRQGRNKGVMEVEFYNREDLERLVEQFIPGGL
jgi:ParB family chromosome partitioning protein